MPGKDPKIPQTQSIWLFKQKDQLYPLVKGSASELGISMFPFFCLGSQGATIIRVSQPHWWWLHIISYCHDYFPLNSPIILCFKVCSPNIRVKYHHCTEFHYVTIVYYYKYGIWLSTTMLTTIWITTTITIISLLISINHH